MRLIVRNAAVYLILLGFLVGPVMGFKPAIHQQITTEALSDSALARTDPVTGQTLQFTNQAMADVSLANYQTDCGTGLLTSPLCICYSCQTDSSRHFDDEAFDVSTARLITLKQGIIANITSASPDGATARRDLGFALHTIQDFYAHSNWVEAGGSLGGDPRLGVSTFTGLPLGTPTSPNGDPGTLTYLSTDPPTSGWFPLPLACFPPTGKTRHGVDPSLLVGLISPALFVLYDCPNGLNKDDSTRFGYSTFPSCRPPHQSASNSMRKTALAYMRSHGTPQRQWLSQMSAILS